MGPFYLGNLYNWLRKKGRMPVTLCVLPNYTTAAPRF